MEFTQRPVWYGAPWNPPSQSSLTKRCFQAWHCDMGTDILALHVRSLAETGGSTFVSSSWTIYKELVASYPEILKALCDPSWPIQV
jgi:hypothetical protein